MRFLYDPFGYFSEKVDVPFLHGLVAVFLSGGLIFTAVLLTLLWISSGTNTSVQLLIDSIGFPNLLYLFFSAFVSWGILSVVFYLTIVFLGIGHIEFMTVMSVTGVGFIPQAIGNTIKLIATTNYIFTNNPTAESLSVHVILTGEFGVVPAALLAVMHVVMLLWSAYIWTGGMSEIGGIPVGRSAMAATLGSALIAVEVVVVAVLF